MDKTVFRRGKRVVTFGAVQIGAAALALPAGAALAVLAARGADAVQGPGATGFLALCATGVAGLAALAAAAVRDARAGPGELAPSIRAVVEAIPGALGDAALVLDGRGRVVQANAAAARLLGVAPERLVGHAVAREGEDLAILLRGLARGPATGFATIAAAAGPARARAAALRVTDRPPLDLVVLRPEPPPRPPGAPAPARPPPLPRARGAPAPFAAALADAVREPLARAATAASLLRLCLPAPPPVAVRALARLEAELAAAERRVAALAAADAGPPAGRRPVDAAAAVDDALAAAGLPPGVRVRRALAPGEVLADGARLRRALREVIHEAAAAMPEGGELAVAVVARGAELVIEVRDTGAPPGGAAAFPLARALLGEEGGRLEREPLPGRGSVCRIALPAAAASRAS